jgi:hypothetical protein
MCLREQRKKQFDWLVTNTDGIPTQSRSLLWFSCSVPKYLVEKSMMLDYLA